MRSVSTRSQASKRTGLWHLRGAKEFTSSITLAAFLATNLSPSFAFAQDEHDSVELDPEASAEIPSVDETTGGSTPTDAPAVVDTSSATSADTSEKEQEALLDHLKDEAGIEDGEQSGVTASLDGVGAANVVLPTADKSGVTGKQISIPKGEGTIKGMEESFSAQLSTGIATFSVPFALPAARGKAQPSLGLSYSSSSGLGIAGMGWGMDAPFIARQTDRGVPKYDDRDSFHHEQDRFVFNGGQELVPICTVEADLVCAGALIGIDAPPNALDTDPIDEQMPAWSEGWQYFRPRVEGSFLRFFWSPNHQTWRVQDKGGVTMELGVPLNDSSYTNAIETNPGHSSQIYRWHLVRQYDIYGDTQVDAPAPNNSVVYRYRQDGGQSYLTDIYDTPPATAPATASLSRYAHHTRISYEARTDRTQSYRSGWLIRQSLRPVRVDVTSKPFAGGVTANRELVRRYHLQYDASSHVTLLESVQVEGRCTDTTGEQIVEDGAELLPQTTNCPRLPAMEFEYTRVAGFLSDGTRSTASLGGYEPFDERLLSVPTSPPHSLDEEQTTLLDVNGDSLPDVLVTAAGVYGGKHGVFFNGGNGARADFSEDKMGVIGVLGANANTVKLSNFNVVPLDVDGDGLANLLHMPKVKTYSVYDPVESTAGWNWVGRTITNATNNNPKVDFGNDTLDIRVMDVNFDGLVDVVASQGTEFQTFFSLGRYPKGDSQFGSGVRTGKETATISTDPVSTCVPWSSTPLRFSDGDTELADMNGDGITDIVRLRRGDIRYWPGRGTGYFGTGDPSDCPPSSFEQDGDLEMTSSPYYTDIQGTSLRLEDVNGDGLPDLVQVNFNDVSVWLNVDGTGWTPRYIIDGTPPSPAYANRVRLTDVNASGTLDILWGDGNSYKYIDLAGGVRPWLLKKVSNGLGKTTEVTYTTSAQEMLEAKNANREWASTMPTLVHMVKRVTENDNLTIAGRSPARYVTEYTYRDPVYEGRQREFRGFREAEAKKVGDSNSPTSITRSVFLLGECQDMTDDSVDDCATSERWRDNPREALKGLPVITETRDENGVYLSTVHNRYNLRPLYNGLDGRGVRYAFLSETESYLYDTAPFSGAPSTQTVPVVYPETLSGGGEFIPGDPDEIIALTVRSAAGTALIRSTSEVDAFGNQTVKRSFGVVDEDEPIVQFTVPAPVEDDASGWLWRTALTFTYGHSAPSTTFRNVLEYSYDTNGDPIETQALIEGSVPLDREVSDSALHPLRSSISAANITVAENEYDDFGNLVIANGAGQRSSEVEYDESYLQLPITETIFAGPQSLSDAGASGYGVNGISTSAVYDRGLGVVTAAQDANGQPTRIDYDEFGRLSKLWKPHPSSDEYSPNPSVRIEYFLPPSAGEHHSLIHTETQDTDDLEDSGFLESWAYVDGLGRTLVTLSEAEEAPGTMESTTPRWIVGGLSEWDQKSAVRRKYLEFFYQGDPMDFNFSSKPNVPYGRQRYDAFGRQFQTFDLDGTVTLQSEYHALSTDLWDAADLEPGGEHTGSFTSETKDGHGRVVETAERFRVDGEMETRYTRTQYLPTGEPEIIRRVRGSTGEETTRWFVYDSLGRMVLNVEPHTSLDYELDESPNNTFENSTQFAGVTAWRYAYNDAGDLVGTSDARGCGSNFFYDAAGRLIGEDYFPCESHHASYSEPDADTELSGDGLEVYYEYDTEASSGPVGRTQEYLVGRLSRVRDQARTTLVSYDGRGRSTWTAAQIAEPGAVSSTLDDRYAPRWYIKDFTYDAADRPSKETTGAQNHLGASSESAFTYQYSLRGAIQTVQSSYGPLEPQHQGEGGPNGRYLVSDILRTADGRIEKIEYGDLARTATTYTYDDRRRAQSVVTSRAPPDAEDVWPEDYYESPETFQLLLQDEEYAYDVVNNPIEIRDWRIASEWPDGAKPVTKKIDYDDLYRASRISYEYSEGDDDWTSPFAAENEAVSTSAEIDPRRALPSPHVSFAKRILWQSYRYDWLGNQEVTDDDAKGFYDRSLGAVTNGENNPGGERNVPYQLKTAEQSGASGGELETAYDVTGNLTRLLLDRDGTCLPTGASCDQWYEYDWDEVGRLSRARRWDGDLTVIDIEVDDPAADLSYRYDADDNRVLKTATDASANQIHTVYVFASLELRRATFDDDTADDYHLDDLTEVPYLFANGVRLARVHFEPDMDPEIGTPAVGQGDLRVFFELGDHLGSASVVLDKGTSELVQRSTFQAYGGSESDYRPDRWKNFREDYRFTGKEEDVEVGLQYFGKRYLNPLLGRWVSADPLEVQNVASGEPNAYAYVSGRALKNVDPIGLCGPKCGTQGAPNAGAEDPKPKTLDHETAEFQHGYSLGEEQAEVELKLWDRVEAALERYFGRADLDGNGLPDSDNRPEEQRQTDLQTDLESADKEYKANSLARPENDLERKGFDSAVSHGTLWRKIQVGLRYAIPYLQYSRQSGGPSRAQSKPAQTARPYSHLKDHRSVGPGKDFTTRQREKILEANRARNGGVLRDDVTGELLVQPTQSRKGVTPDPMEAQVDHVFPKAEGGSNSFSNARVRARKHNAEKGDAIVIE